MNGRVRVPAVAGMFYPADPDELHQSVRRFLDHAETPFRLPPKAIIVPHAGYVYSGAVAAGAYACVEASEISRVVLIGPAHRVMLRGLAAPESLLWETPVGDVMIDIDALDRISSFPQLVSSERAHQAEHCLEVQLPFLRELFGDNFLLTPLLAGDSRPDEVADVLDALWDGPETLIVVSSDLSHYLPYQDAVEKDRATVQAIENLDVSGLETDSACGLNAIAGLICAAQRHGLRVQLLDQRNSGDTAGSKDQVVGYASFAFYE
jgi:MEMO1 family protein